MFLSLSLCALQVALKMIRKKDISSARMFKRLHREVNNMKKLHHPNIIGIIDSKCYKKRCKFVVTGAMERS